MCHLTMKALRYFQSTKSSHVHILFDSRVRMRRSCGTAVIHNALTMHCPPSRADHGLIFFPCPNKEDWALKFLALCGLLYPDSGQGNKQAPHKGTSRSRGTIQKMRLARACEMPLKPMPPFKGMGFPSETLNTLRHLQLYKQ